MFVCKHVPKRLMSSAIKRSPLDSLHREYNGIMVSFSGWELPIRYESETIIESHLHTRASASLFDVSHMLQTRIYGRDRNKFMESLVVGDVHDLQMHKCLYTLFTNSEGGILDDAMIQKMDDHILVITNAATSSKMLQHMSTNAKTYSDEIKVFHQTNYAMVALQGPLSSTILSDACQASLTDVNFCQGRTISIGGVTCYANRCGYTGEDGFEILIPIVDSVAVCKILLSNSRVKMAGLGARDTLRLEAGLCLYGHDINEETTPVEAGLRWAIGKQARAQGLFPGFNTIMSQMQSGVSKMRVGLEMTGAQAREKDKLFKGDVAVGEVTSGSYSPTLKHNIAMGYVQTSNSIKETTLTVEVRKKKQPAKIVKMPFVPHRYYKT